MTGIGEIERKTQDRVIGLVRDSLGYEYMGDLSDYYNENIIDAQLRKSLKNRGYSPILVDRAVEELIRVSRDTTKNLYERNRNVYDLLRYGARVKPDPQSQAETVWFIDWQNVESNHFGIAEEVTVRVRVGEAPTKRPDVVLYVNGIALGVLELKRSTVSVSEGIRQNLENQRSEFIQHFFSTIQWVMAGNDSQGLRYGTIETPEKYYLTWKEDGPQENPLDRSVLQVFEKHRFLELIHDFIVFDSGIKKVCRHNQFFGTKAAAAHAQRHDGGVIWHTQGSGKSLTMVWLAKWIRENIEDSRVVIVTDRTELDEQIENVFLGVNENIYRCKSGADLAHQLNVNEKPLMCSLIHKFGSRVDGASSSDSTSFIEQLKASLPPDFSPKGNIFIFVDECHRTQAGMMHKAMKEIVPGATLIGFTGTPLLRSDKAMTIAQFGPYIHTYKFDEAVFDEVIVDLRYEARDIEQRITEQDRIDQWFATKTAALTDIAKAELKKKWGTMQQVLSSRSRLNQIVGDIVFDMETRPRLMSGRGNALLVASSITEACIYYDLFQKTPLKGKCGVVTSYSPTIRDLVGEDAGEGETLAIEQFKIYKMMLADYFNDPSDTVTNRVEEYEKAVKKTFVQEPGQMKLLIVVDKLLTGFDAPSATYLYIDKQMRDHGLFQAICRVNRLDGDDKEYGYVIDYKDLFKSLEQAVKDYTADVLDGYNPEDVEGLLKDRLHLAKEDLDEALEQIRALVEPVAPPKDEPAYNRYFCSNPAGDQTQLKENEPKRLAFYKQVARVMRAFAGVAGDEMAAGYTVTEFSNITKEVREYAAIRDVLKLVSGDYIDLKMYEPFMRYLIDSYIKADQSNKVSTFDDMSFVQLLVKKGEGAVDDLPDNIKNNKKMVAELIQNNVRKVIIDERPINPKYFDKMSELLDALVEKLRLDAIEYQAFLKQVAQLAQKITDPNLGGDYPPAINSAGKRALFDFLFRVEDLTLEVDKAVRSSAQDGWRENRMKIRRVNRAVKDVLDGRDIDVVQLIELVKANVEY
jgi:type I restriction enzyme R subunit